MAHVVQLILGAFMSSIKVKSKDGHMPSGFKADYIDKVMRLDNGFHKTIEKVISKTPYRCNSFTICELSPKHIRTDSYAQIHMPKLKSLKYKSKNMNLPYDEA